MTIKQVWYSIDGMEMIGVKLWADVPAGEAA